MFTTLKNRALSVARRLRKDEKGNSAVEYSLIAALVGVISIAGFQLVGQNVSKTAVYLGCEMNAASTLPNGGTPTSCTWGGAATPG